MSRPGCTWAGHMLRASRTLTTLVAVPCPSTSVLVAQHSLGIAEPEVWSWVCCQL